MVFTKEITKLEKSGVRLTITMANKDVRDVYDAGVKDIAKEIQFKGFRKGKVPPSIIEAKLKNVLREQVLNDIISKSTTEAFEMEDFPKDLLPLPYSDPQVEGAPALDLSGDFSFSVTYDAFPSFEVTRYEGFETEIEQAAIGDADIARELEILRERNAIVLDREEGAAAAAGDVATIEVIELDGAGKPLPDARTEFPLVVGERRHSLDIDDDIAGLKKNGEKTVEKTYPADWKNPTLAGKTKRFTIKLLALKEKKLPALDDELAQDIDEKFKTLADLKANIREKLEAALEERVRDLKIERILARICEANPAEIPDSMLKLDRLNRLQTMYGGGGADKAKLRELIDNDTFMNQLFPRTRDGLHARLVIEKLKPVLKVEAGDEDIQKEFDRVAEREGIERDEAAAFYADEEKRDALKDNILSKKVIDILLEKNTARPGKKVSYLEMMGGAEAAGRYE